MVFQFPAYELTFDYPHEDGGRQKGGQMRRKNDWI